MARATLLLVLLWLAFVVRGVWYCALLPPWEGYDEPFHFAALQHVAAGQGMPHADTPISLEVQKSLHLLPLPWMLTLHDIPHPLMSHEEYWKLTSAEREQRIAAVRALSPDDGKQPAAEPILNYEYQQTPLYYWLFAFPTRATASLSLLSRIYLLRLLSVLSASVAIPLAYWIARRVLQTVFQALGVAAIIALLPELMIDVARVGNESLALLCYTAMLAAAVLVVQQPMAWRAWLSLGAALGAGLLAKAYVLSAIPVVISVGLLAVWYPSGAGERRAKPVAIIARLAAALAVAGAIAGRWYAVVHKATGSWTGMKDDIAISHLSWLQKLSQVAHVNWKSGVLSISISHVWFGAWSFLRVPNFVCVLVFAVIAFSMAGGIVRWRRDSTAGPERRDILVLAAFYLCFWAGLLYSVVVNFLSQGVSASTGWYLYATVAAEVVLLVWGLQAFVPARFLFPCLALGLAALDLYGAHALMMPYYTGLTAHVGKTVPAALWPTLTQLPTVFQRLGQLRPGWLGARVLLSCWIAYWIATLGTVFAVVVLFRKPAEDHV